MAKFRKPLISKLAKLWAERLPDWHQGRCSPVTWAQPDGVFSTHSLLLNGGKVCHVAIDFSSKWKGTFTGDIVITSKLEPSAEPVPLCWRWPEDVPALAIGTYRIGWFVDQRDIWWHLIDEAAESRQFWLSISPEGSISREDIDILAVDRRPDDWYATSYDVPFDQILHAAALHFTDTFERYVLPKLQLHGRVAQSNYV